MSGTRGIITSIFSFQYFREWFVDDVSGHVGLDEVTIREYIRNKKTKIDRQEKFDCPGTLVQTTCFSTRHSVWFSRDTANWQPQCSSISGTSGVLHEVSLSDTAGRGSIGMQKLERKRYWGGHLLDIGYGGWSSGNVTEALINEYLDHHGERPFDVFLNFYIYIIMYKNYIFCFHSSNDGKFCFCKTFLRKTAVKAGEVSLMAFIPITRRR